MEEKGVATLERALTILAAFTAAEPQLSLAELSRRTGLYKSTLLRLLATLERFDYVGQHADGSYHVGPGAFYLGSLYQRWVQPPTLIQPVLQQLVASTGESASFNVPQGEVRVCVYRIDSPHTIRDHIRVGDVLPMAQGAVGRLLRAFGVAATDALDPALDDVRRQCSVATRGEIAADMAAVAVPVFAAGPGGGDAVLAGSLALTGPTSRFTDATMPGMRRHLLQAAADLSYRLGGRHPGLEAAAAQAGASLQNL